MCIACESAAPEPESTICALCRDLALTVAESAARPYVNVLGDLHDDAEQIRDVVRRVNGEKPELFRTGGELARIGRTEQNHPVIRAHTEHSFAEWVSRYSRWQRTTAAKKVTIPTHPPVPAVRAVRSAPDTSGALALGRVVQVPFFTSGGALADAAGYHADGCTWYEPSKRFDVPPVAEVPPQNHVDKSVSLIFNELLVDFPFASDGDRAGAAALLLEPFVRDMITGPTPLHLIEASTPGTGKTKLALNCAAVALGCAPRDVAAKPLSSEEPEIRKSITADLMEGRPVVFFDNVSHSIRSPALAQALSSGAWSDRKLGEAGNVQYPIRCSWVMTSNNAGYDVDMARRISLIRLDLSSLGVPASVQEHPETRDPETLRHADLERWVMEHQGQLVWACLTLVQSWVAARRPQWPGTPLGSFESWSQVVGGVLEYAGVRGFLTNREKIEASGADDRGMIVEFLEGWWAAYRDAGVSAQDLGMLNIGLADDGSGGGVLGLNSKIGSSKAMGYWLKRHRDQVIGGFRIAPTPSNVRKWHVRQI